MLAMNEQEIAAIVDYVKSLSLADRDLASTAYGVFFKDEAAARIRANNEQWPITQVPNGWFVGYGPLGPPSSS
jgi:hypothetical protein